MVSGLGTTFGENLLVHVTVFLSKGVCVAFPLFWPSPYTPAQLIRSLDARV